MRTFVVSRMLLSTEYPISIRRAAVVANESSIPKMFMQAAVIVMSATPAKTTVNAGRIFLKAIKTTTAIPRNANKSAKNACA